MGVQLKPIEKDAIGEVMNISMGAAATAVSTLLDKQVTITTPRVTISKIGDLSYEKLEPAIVVKITYTEGISGSNVMVIKQRDMQLILNQLMGIDEPPSDDFVFDDLSMSAACEIMNQMMGSSATALSNFLGFTVNISTPTAEVLKNRQTFLGAVGLDESCEVVSIIFTLTIGKLVESEFISIVSENLAREILSRFLKDSDMENSSPPVSATIDSIKMVSEGETAQVVNEAIGQAAQQYSEEKQTVDANLQQSVYSNTASNMYQQGLQQPTMDVNPQQMSAQLFNQAPPVQPMQNMSTMPQTPDISAVQSSPTSQTQPLQQAQQFSQMPQAPQMGYPQYMGYPYTYGYPQMYQSPAPQQPVSVAPVKLAEFGGVVQPNVGPPIMYGNMGLIMNVPLSVTVEIGSAKRKIKDIMEFNQGTVIELDKQAGAPVDIIVNGQLFARGDVVVLDDNFGVRITEIIGTKELLDSLEKGAAV